MREKKFIDSDTLDTLGIDTAVHKKTALKITPLVLLLYFICFLDRSNISYAALRMNTDLGLSTAAFGLGAGLFFIGYVLFQVPSNIALTKFGPRRWIGLIAVAWGIIAAFMSSVKSPESFYTLRFLLGAVEAGLFPGILYYLSLWFPLKNRGRITAMLVVAGSASPLIGAPLSTWLMEVTDGHAGMHGWQLMFIIEAIPAIALGIWCFFKMPNGPRDVQWLTPEQRDHLETTLSNEAEIIKSIDNRSGTLKAVFTLKVFTLGLIFLGFVFGEYAIGFFLPLIIDELNTKFNTGLSVFSIGVLGAIPYLVAAIAIIVWGYSSDKQNERVFHTAAPALIAAGAIISAVYSSNLTLAIIAFSVTVAGVLSAQTIFWQLPARLLTGTAAAAGLALINAMGNFAGFLGPMIMGTTKDYSGNYDSGLWIMAIILALSAIGTFTMGAKARNMLEKI